MSKLTEQEVRQWLATERDFWKLRTNGLFDSTAKGTNTPMHEALDQVLEMLGPLREPDQIVSVIDARLGAGWTASLAKCLSDKPSEKHHG